VIKPGLGMSTGAQTAVVAAEEVTGDRADHGKKDPHAQADSIDDHVHKSFAVMLTTNKQTSPIVNKQERTGTRDTAPFIMRAKISCLGKWRKWATIMTYV
jgi:hypothetical protein